ncbi:MAG: iron-containing alcohol dehydrogenase [Gemmatimonadota bacterium]
MAKFDNARARLRDFKGEKYLHGMGILPQVGAAAAGLGKRAGLVVDAFPGSQAYVAQIRRSLAEAGVELLGEVRGAAPNAPLEDLARVAAELRQLAPEVVVSFGGGSTIDVTKAAIVLWNLGGEIEQYFGTGMVTGALQRSGKTLTPHVAIQTAASSGGPPHQVLEHHRRARGSEEADR